MAKKVTPATVENVVVTPASADGLNAIATAVLKNSPKHIVVNPATVEAPEAPATVEAKPAKINLRKEEKEMTKETKTAKAPVNAPATVTAPVKAIKETDPVTAPALDIEAEKTRITRALEIENVRLQCFKDVDDKGAEINPTNWGKNETSNGNPTVGGYVRDCFDKAYEQIESLKRELKCLYFTLDPVLVSLQDSENVFVQALINACIDNMRNVVIISHDDFYKEQAYYNAPLEMRPEITDTLKALASAGVERVGVAVELLGVAIPILAVAGYMFEAIAQPVEIEGKNIAGLDPVPACTYYSFKKA